VSEIQLIALAFLAIGLVAFLSAWGQRRTEARIRDLIVIIDKVDLRSNSRDLELVNSIQLLAGLPPITEAKAATPDVPPPTHTSDVEDVVK
jgi:hypothetical protein